MGTDNIDKQAATRLGIVVMNTPLGNTVSTAEHTLTLMLALSRNVAPAYQSLIEHRWDRGTHTFEIAWSAIQASIAATSSRPTPVRRWVDRTPIS